VLDCAPRRGTLTTEPNQKKRDNGDAGTHW
jgi:hypothetical protein